MAKDLRWESLLSKAPAVSSMVRPARGELLNGTQSSIAKGTEVIPRLGGEGGKIGQEARVVKRTWVAMAKDAPVYDLGWFRNGMRGVREREVSRLVSFPRTRRLQLLTPSHVFSSSSMALGRLQ